MACSEALYYPWIDIRDEGWLKSAVLYWDSIRTIVPEPVEVPYRLQTARELQDAGVLIPLRVRSGIEEIEALTGEVKKYLNSGEGAPLLAGMTTGLRHQLHVEKLPRGLTRLHELKLPDEICHILEERGWRCDHEREWLAVDERFALFYMTLLAKTLAERIGARLLTPAPAAERLAIAARSEGQLQSLMSGQWRGREYEAWGRRELMPRSLAAGTLSELVMKRLSIAGDTPVMTLLDFREAYRDELARFRTKIEELASGVQEELPAEALQQRLRDLVTHEVEPALADLKRALDGRRIRCLSEGLLKVACLSVGSSSMLVAAGLAVPTALLASAGLSLAVSGIMYNVDKTESLRSNPYAYLHLAQSNLGQRVFPWGV